MYNVRITYNAIKLTIYEKINKSIDKLYKIALGTLYITKPILNNKKQLEMEKRTFCDLFYNSFIMTT